MRLSGSFDSSAINRGSLWLNFGIQVVPTRKQGNMIASAEAVRDPAKFLLGWMESSLNGGLVYCFLQLLL